MATFRKEPKKFLSSREIDWGDLISSFAVGGIGGALGTGYSFSKFQPRDFKHHAIWGGGSVVANILRQAAQEKLDVKNIIGGLIASSLGYATMTAITQSLVGGSLKTLQQQIEQNLRASLTPKKKGIFERIKEFFIRK